MEGVENLNELTGANETILGRGTTNETVAVIADLTGPAEGNCCIPRGRGTDCRGLRASVLRAILSSRCTKAGRGGTFTDEKGKSERLSHHSEVTLRERKRNWIGLLRK